MEITADTGADIIFDPVAGPYIENLTQAASQHGMVFNYGMLDPRPTPFPMAPAFTKGLSLRAYTLFEVTGQPALLDKGKRYVYDGLKSGAVNPVENHREGLAGAESAATEVTNPGQWLKSATTGPLLFLRHRHPKDGINLKPAV